MTRTKIVDKHKKIRKTKPLNNTLSVFTSGILQKSGFTNIVLTKRSQNYIFEVDVCSQKK